MKEIIIESNESSLVYKRGPLRKYNENGDTSLLLSTSTMMLLCSNLYAKEEFPYVDEIVEFKGLVADEENYYNFGLLI